MAKSPSTNDIAKSIQSLQDERAQLAARLAEIDELFAQVGISTGGAKATVKTGRRGRPPKAASAAPAKAPTKKRGRKKGGRGKFPISGEESVYQFVKANGPVTTAEINTHWQTEGRGGKADNALTKLTSEGKLTRKKIEGSRGSTYTAK